MALKDTVVCASCLSTMLTVKLPSSFAPEL